MFRETPNHADATDGKASMKVRRVSAVPGFRRRPVRVTFAKRSPRERTAIMTQTTFQSRVERLLDRTEIFDLVRFERLCRDQRDFAGMVGCYVKNAPVRTTWFAGTVEDFAE